MEQIRNNVFKSFWRSAVVTQRAEVQCLAGDLHVGLIGDSKLGLAVTVFLFTVTCNGLVTHQSCAPPQHLHYSNMDKLLRKWIDSWSCRDFCLS